MNLVANFNFEWLDSTEITMDSRLGVDKRDFTYAPVVPHLLDNINVTFLSFRVKLS